jgi:hypothetical protein
VRVSAATARRQAEAVGATARAEAEAEVARWEEECPAPPEAPERLVLSADGAMVPLAGGEGAAVKRACVGEPQAAGGDAGADAPRPGQPSSCARLADADACARLADADACARLADADAFARAAWGERHRRGLEAAGQVAAVQDGAPWLQGFADFHRPDAGRLLDWPPAAQRLGALAEALCGAGTPRAARAGARLRGSRGCAAGCGRRAPTASWRSWPPGGAPRPRWRPTSPTCASAARSWPPRPSARTAGRWAAGRSRAGTSR